VTAARLLVQTSLQSICWGDIDVFGHGSNSGNFRYLEQIRIAWLAAHDPPLSGGQN